MENVFIISITLKHKEGSYFVGHDPLTRSWYTDRFSCAQMFNSSHLAKNHVHAYIGESFDALVKSAHIDKVTTQFQEAIK